MSIDDLADVDSAPLTDWHWYVLVGYPVLSILGIVSLGQLTGGGSIFASSLGSVALLIVMTAYGAVTLPAIWFDTEFVRGVTDDWDPDPEIYVGAAAGVPLFLGLLVALTAGLGAAIAISVFAFLVSTVAVCVAYLYNRHRTIGLLTR